MLKITLILFALLTLSASHLPANEYQFLWSSWKTYHGKIYGSLIEEMRRFQNFIVNYNHIIEYNKNSDDVRLALNKFSDLTPQEFKQIYTGCFHYAGPVSTPNELIDYSVLDLPLAVDWRKKGAVTPVKNQQTCGSCWAFSATGALEGLYFLKNGKLVSFSEQQLVDCDTSDQGCEGGLPSNAFQYTEKEGLETEEDYPYKNQDGKCHVEKSKTIKTNTGYKAVQVNNVKALKTAVVGQPVSVGVEADQNVFHHYKSGVVKAGCGAALDHGVLVVGYKIVNGLEAWIVKNSWGEDWGQDGYLHISTNGRANDGAGVCGILAAATVPTN
jgi:C1A family cysteine protease